MASERASGPIFWIVGGPNGSGKSSVYSDTRIESFGGTVWIINPDLLTVRISQVEGIPTAEANLQAVRRIEAWLDTSIDAHQTVGVETVMSTGKYRRLVTKAKTLGFEVRLIYVVLRSPDLNVERVRIRVQKGGHDVPEDKIRERYNKSLSQLPWFFENADSAYLFDNSTATPVLMIRKSDGRIDVFPGVLPSVIEALGLARR